MNINYDSMCTLNHTSCKLLEMPLKHILLSLGCTNLCSKFSFCNYYTICTGRNFQFIGNGNIFHFISLISLSFQIYHHFLVFSPYTTTFSFHILVLGKKCNNAIQLKFNNKALCLLSMINGHHWLMFVHLHDYQLCPLNIQHGYFDSSHL